MPFAPFHEKLPEIAKKETRSVTVLGMPGIPPGEYGLIELYCDESGCDCRRVFLCGLGERQRAILATVCYGWESREFYARWMGDNDPDVLDELQGPALNLTSSQSSLAPALLELVKNVLKDPAYVERIKRHYTAFRQLVDKPKSRR